VTTTERPRTRAPISVQLVALLVLSLLAAQAISFAIIVLMPPPRPPMHRISDIAAALRGGPLQVGAGRPMTRTAAETLPPDLRRPRPAAEWGLQSLAMMLNRPVSDVRLAQSPPSFTWRLMREMRRGEPAPERAFRGSPRWDHERGGATRAPRSGVRPDGPLFGDFGAAVRAGDSWVVVRSTPEPFPNAWQLRTSMWLLAGLLVVAPAGYLFARRITAPLKRFAVAAEALGRDPHAPQMTLRGPAEIGAAAHAFNEMQARLKRYIDDRTAMVGAISHDLRTPLARIRFKMEAAPPALRDSVTADVAQMEQMIGGVLTFIRNEGEPKRRERLDLLSLLECVADDAGAMGADVELVEGEAVTVDGDAIGLQRLFANLVDNAVRYGRQARIRVRQETDAAVVEIADRGAGLSDEELERVFKPFYRTDASRNLDNAGVGLGLPIARSIARAHGGEVTLSSTGAGLVASVRLPRDPAFAD
jgi:signal transduction histidine kinase